MTKIRINVYDIIDAGKLKQFGLGLHHSGVQIGECSEYEYSDGGISVIKPKTATGVTFVHSIELGNIKQDIITIALREMQTEFTCDNYDILSRNCNHFTEQFVYKLTNFRVPKYLNRVASLFAFDKNSKANTQFINFLNRRTKLKWFPITNTMIDLANNGVLNDEIPQIGILQTQYDDIQHICHKTYQFQETIYGFKVYTKERPLVANIWLFNTHPTNEFMTVYSGPKNSFLLHFLLKNEFIRTQYLSSIFQYRYKKTDINMLANAGDYIEILNCSPKYNAFIRFLLTGHLNFKELTRDSDNATP